MDAGNGGKDEGSINVSPAMVQQLEQMWNQMQKQGASTLLNTSTSAGEQGKSTADESSPPPLPPRVDATNSVNRSPYGGSYGTGYGGYGSSYGMSPYSSMYGGGGMFGGYGSPYSAYGGYGAGYRTTNYGETAGGSDFIRLAEESSRQAFQSIESIVQAFASVSLMLESTYFAVHSSFRAVLGVADHFARLRGHMASLTLIRSLSLYLKKLAYIVGLSSIDPSDEEAWRRALNLPSSDPNNPDVNCSSSAGSFAEVLAQGNNARKSSWPIMLFFAVVFGTPWLIWKLLMGLTNSAGISASADSKWTLEMGPHYLAKGLYDFVSNSEKELPFKKNQRLIVAPKELQPAIRGWLLASDGKVTGLVPANYIEITAHKKGDIESGVLGVQSNPGESNDMQLGQARETEKLEDAFTSASAASTAPPGKSSSKVVQATTAITSNTEDT